MNNFLFIPFRLKRKIDSFKSVKSHYSERFIEKIEKVGFGKCQCIAIGHPDKLYITDDFIVTHNTTICLHAAADALKKGKKVLYIDAEHALDETYCKNLGADLENIIFFQPDFGEQAFEYAEKLLETGEIGLVIFDSTSGMIPKSQFDAEPGTTSIGKHAMLFNKEMPKINSITAKYNVVTIFISQVREKIGILFGSPETTQGGNALKFFASNRIELRKSTQEKEGDSVVGNLVKFKTLKCKTAPPFKTGDFLIEYGLGIQRWKDIMDLAIDANIIEKVGNTYSLNGVKLGIGEKQLIDTLQNKEGLLQEIEDLLLNNKAVTEKIKENESENKEVE